MKKSFYLMCAGLFFFLIPSYGLIDIAPDLIGAFLIIMSLSRLRDADTRLEEARGLLLRFFFIDLGKNILALPVHTLRDGLGNRDGVAVLTVCLVYSVISAILLYGGLTKLFSGINYIAERVGCPYSDENYGGVRVMASMFSVLYYVMLLIPQLISLSNPDYSMTQDVGKLFEVYEYKTLITLLCMVASLFLSVLFVSSCVGYLRRIMKHAPTLEALDGLCEAGMAAKGGVITCRRAKTGFIFAFSGLVMLISFRIEGVNIIPHFIGYVLLYIASGRLVEFSERAKLLKRTAVPFSLISLGAFVFCMYVGNEYYHTTSVEDKVMLMKNLGATAECIEYAMLFITSLLLTGLLCDIVAKHTRRVYETDDAYQSKRDEQELARRKKRLAVKGIVLSVVVCAVGCVCSVLSPSHDEAWLVPQVLIAVWLVACGKEISRLYELMENKYL